MPAEGPDKATGGDGADPMAKTREERRAIERYILEHPDHADATIARDLGVTRPTVRCARARLVARGELAPGDEAVQGDGSTYPARPAWQWRQLRLQFGD
jgi:hypothetical protein